MPVRSDRPPTSSVAQCLDRLEVLLESRGSWFRGAARREEARRLLHDVRAQVAAEAGRLARAQAEAEATLRRAEEDAKRFGAEAQQRSAVNGDAESVHAANAEARDIRAMANREADEVRRSADAYALGVFERLDAEVSRVVTTIRRGKAILGERTAGSATGAAARLDNEKMASV